MTTTTFFQPGTDHDAGYINVRDNPCLAEDRAFVEHLWEKYYPYADTNFLTDARKHFQERFWEMYVGVAVLERGFPLHRGSAKGPEFYFDCKERKVWVEAIAPGQGEGPDAVPELEYGKPVATRVPEEEIILRIRHALLEKNRKLQVYRDSGIVAPTDGYILAINSRRMRAALADANLPFIVKAVFPFGHLVAVWDTSSNDVVDTHYEHRPTVQKKSGATVSTDVFLSAEYSAVSAVLYSRVDCLNRSPALGDDFRVVHNPMATNPLEVGSFGMGTEYWKDGDELRSKAAKP